VIFSLKFLGALPMRSDYMAQLLSYIVKCMPVTIYFT